VPCVPVVLLVAHKKGRQLDVRSAQQHKRACRGVRRNCIPKGVRVYGGCILKQNCPVVKLQQPCLPRRHPALLGTLAGPQKMDASPSQKDVLFDVEQLVFQRLREGATKLGLETLCNLKPCVRPIALRGPFLTEATGLSFGDGWPCLCTVRISGSTRSIARTRWRRL